MKRVIPMFLVLMLFLVIGLPSLLAGGCQPQASGNPSSPPATVDKTPIESPAGDVTLSVYRHDQEQLVEMPLEEYLVGVVSAEMPASFALEALKAQAVSARTYTVNQMKAYGGTGCDKHPDADICTDSTHCQAWESEETSMARWKAEDAAAYYHKIRSAVSETAGKVVTYQNEYIDAVFHSNCGGHTENSEDVWSSALPYLRGVSCPYCQDSRWYETTHEFTGATFADAVVPYVSAMPVSASGQPLLGEAVRTATGRIKSLTIAGEAVTGRNFRSALGLPSTNVTWSINGDKVVFTAKGYGHGVGFCQYGADGMAKQDKTYAEILQHYYSGVEITTIGTN